MSTDFKVCCRCRIALPLERYTANKRAKDGLNWTCKGCVSVYTKAYSRRPEVKAKVRLAGRKRTMSGSDKERRRLYMAAYRKTERGKLVSDQANQNAHLRGQRKAYSRIFRAVRDGKIIRKECEYCGAFAHAHHEDYSKPLEVRWLCSKHHGMEHWKYA